MSVLVLKAIRRLQLLLENKEQLINLDQGHIMTAALIKISLI